MNALIKSLATTRAGLGLTILRVLVGITFMALSLIHISEPTRPY